MTVKGGTTPACAACKYQRRKCSPNCPLAPYFPANQTKMFRNVHRLFGVSNVTKTLEKLKTKDQKEDAMKSIIYEAEMRERFPVHGCCAIIAHLRHQLQFASEELRCVYTQLEACREQMNKHVEQPLDSWPLAQMEFGSSSNNDVPFNQFFLNENSGFCAQSPNNMAKPLLTLDPHSDTMSNNLTAIQAQMDAFGIQDRNMYSQDFEGKQFNTMIDNRQYYIETKDAFGSRYHQLLVLARI